MAHPIFDCAEYLSASETALPNPEGSGPCDPSEGIGEAGPLDRFDYQILTLHLAGVTPVGIATELGLPTASVLSRLASPALQDLSKRIETLTIQKLADLGTVEPITRAKAAAPDAMRTIVRLSRNTHDAKTRLHAASTILKYAGVEPPRKIELTAPDRLLDLMTPQELVRLADEKVWPARFADQLRHLLPSPSINVSKLNETVVETEPPDSPEPSSPPPGDGGISEEWARQPLPDPDEAPKKAANK